MLVLHGNIGLSRAKLSACFKDTTTETVLLEDADTDYIRGEATLSRMDREQYCRIVPLPEPCMTKPFWVEAILNPVCIIYPGVPEPLNLIKHFEVTLWSS